MTWTQRAVYRKRVGLGIAVLERVAPDWAGRVDVARLDMHSQVDDVLGQLFGSYIDGAFAIQPHVPDGYAFLASDHGFGLPLYEQMADEDVVRSRFAILTEVWRDEIATRLTNQQV